jgi:hypothetical protein
MTYLCFNKQILIQQPMYSSYIIVDNGIMARGIEKDGSGILLSTDIELI